jgi:hypothetical protein
MKRSVAIGIFGSIVAGAAMSASAQTASAPRGSDSRRQRYQVGTMERVLEGAVEHGAALTRERLQAYLPADMLLSEGARVRGFRLEGYGMFFDVAVPSLEGTLAWTFRALDRNNLGLETALRTLRSFIDTASPNDANVQQAFKRLELQVGPAAAATSLAVNSQRDVTATSDPAGLTSLVAAAPPQLPPPAPDPILDNPQEAYRVEVRDALMNAMLEHSRGLEIAPDEWLTIAARSHESRSRLSPVDTDSQTVIIKVRGVDLNAFLGGQISREEARKRMDVRVF